MKASIVLLIFAVVIYTESVASQHRQEDEMKVANECKEIEGATDDDIECYKVYDLPTTSTGKCLHACVQEKFGLMNDAGVVPDAFVKHAKDIYGETNDLAIAVAEKISIECVHISHDDRCERGFQLAECAHTVFEQHAAGTEETE